MTHVFRSPKFHKELRMQYGPDKAISDSEENSEAASVRRGSRPKLQAPSSKRQAPSLTSTNNRIIRDIRKKILSECASRDPEPSGKQGSKRQDTNHIGALA